MVEDLQHVPLHAFHIEHGAKMVPFAGFAMPLQYEGGGIQPEHVAVRQHAGLFDVSHMGEVEVEGEDAIEVVNRLVTHDVSTLVDGQALYTVMCYEHGGIVDDLIVYRLAHDHLLLCINAANRHKDVAHILHHATGASTITDTSDSWAQLAIQGPKARGIISALTDGTSDAIAPFHCAWLELDGHRALVARTGYTGEDGFELYIPKASARACADAIYARGQADELKLCGLGCRDTLRLEAKLHLYGQDITELTNPLEAGLSWVVKFGKESFIGKDALLKVKEQGVTRRLRGLIVKDKGIIRQGCDILHDGQKVGEVTSGSFSPTLQCSIGLGYVDVAFANEATLHVAVRKRQLAVDVTKKPFYKRS